jgi:ABC-2 type transport system permease protein
MLALIAYYQQRIKTSFIVQSQYRVALAIWMIGLVLEPVIYLVVWRTVAESSGGQVGGFTPGGFAAYYIVLMVVMHLTQIWHMWEMEYLIRDGTMSGRLLRPIHPIHQDVSENIAYKVLMLIVVIPATLFLVVVFQPDIQTSLWDALLFMPAILLAAVLAFIVGWVVALAAFWTTRTLAINEFYFISMFFFAGQVAPLDLLPDFIRRVADLLPFRWMLSFPVELFLGRLTPQEALEGFSAQVIWIGLAWLALRWVWTQGVRRYGAVGG